MLNSAKKVRPKSKPGFIAAGCSTVAAVLILFIVSVGIMMAVVRSNPWYRAGAWVYGIGQSIGEFFSGPSAMVSGPQVVTDDPKIGIPYLNVPLYPQTRYWGIGRGDSACFVTAVSMTLDYYLAYNYPKLKNTGDLGTNNKEKYYHNYIAGKNKPYAAYANHIPSSLFERNTNPVSSDNWQLVVDSINRKHPVVVTGQFNRYINNRGSWRGHVVVIIGISENQIVIADPAGGKRHVIPKSDWKKYLLGFYQGVISYINSDPNPW